MATVAMPPKSLSDCIADARAGQEEAIEAIFERCRDYLLYVANAEISADIQAKIAPSDVVQESLLKAHQNFPRFAGSSEGELLAWLKQILIRTFIDANRRYKNAACRDVGQEQGAKGLSAVIQPDPSPSAELAADEAMLSLRAAMERLSDEDRQIIRWRTWDGRSFQSIGDELGRTPEAVRKSWCRAILKLKEEWRLAHGDDSRALPW